MTDIVERLHIIRNHLRTGAFGQREVWEEWLTEAAADNERLKAESEAFRGKLAEQCGQTLVALTDNERLRTALKPFAGVASEWDGEDLSLEVELRAYDDRPGPGVSVADFRAARAALEPKP